MAVRIEGIEDLLRTLNGEAVSKSLAKASVGFSKEVRNNIEYLTNSRYAISKSEIKESFLTSSEVNAGNILTVTLNYRHKPTTLGARYSSRFWGNINPEARRQGRVHKVEVKRGSKKIVYGNRHYGGFIPKQGRGLKGSNMYERLTRRRKPLELLFTFSSAQAVEQIFNKSPEFTKYLDLLGDRLLSKTSETIFT